MIYPDRLKHVTWGRNCIILLWSRAFSYWHCSIYCCELLHFWLVSSYCCFKHFIEEKVGFFKYWCSLDNRVKKSLPEKYRQTTQASLLTAVASAAVATLTCYPLDTIRRQMQMKGTPYRTVLDAFQGNWQ